MRSLALFGLTCCAYSNRSGHQNSSGLRLSTIWITTSLFSTTRHSCFHTARFFSNGVTDKPRCASLILQEGCMVKEQACSIKLPLPYALGNTTAPLQKRCLFRSMELRLWHSYPPIWASWNAQLLHDTFQPGAAEPVSTCTRHLLASSSGRRTSLVLLDPTSHQ